MDSIDRTFINTLFTSNYYKGYKAPELYMANIKFKILNKINLTYYLKQDFRTVEEMIDCFNLNRQSGHLLGWMLNFLQYMGYIQSKSSKY